MTGDNHPSTGNRPNNTPPIPSNTTPPIPSGQNRIPFPSTSTPQDPQESAHDRPTTQEKGKESGKSDNGHHHRCALWSK
ncbi:hypothetical protein PGTUg99_018705 [Puccinia graminis f. sp. tritici]|uniref:Uncharacterized protein n=1 Tax=Puccinia graminis f. sp. tritici TaxID=56615 RepID=A0A5B0NS38_PUCGR|nr:hypothetical protein PGTUg99_018705 [Puccinia graminis f. sp. tritici]